MRPRTPGSMTTKLHTYILQLSECTAGDTIRVGTKAANLGDLMRAGFPVPDGFVLTAEAFERFVNANRLDESISPEVAESGIMPDEVADALMVAASGLDGRSLAVRSSGLAEDLAGMSFAGQYESVLDVRGRIALVEAVKHCWASAFSRRVVAYREANGVHGIRPLALLVQQLVAADSAGVAFSANPVTGNRSEVAVSAVRGLGERLVSGRASPDEWLINEGETTCLRSPEAAIDAKQARRIAELTRRAEQHFGTPQDMEWAIAAGKLYVLQSRPITTLSEDEMNQVAVPVEVPSGYWEREYSHFPQPLSPMFRTCFLPALNEGFRNAMNELGVLIDTIEYREIGGWAYRRTVPLGGKDRKAPPGWVMYLMLRLLPQMRKRLKLMAMNLRNDKFGQATDLWYAQWKPEQARRIAELRAKDISEESDSQVAQHFDAAVDFVAESMKRHGLVSIPDFFVAELAFFCRDVLGWDESRTLNLVAGLSHTTSQPSRRLGELAVMARTRPAVSKLLEDIDDRTAERLAEVDTDFYWAFEAYQAEFGCRVMAQEVTVPTLEERPSLPLSLVRNGMRRSCDARSDDEMSERARSDAVAEARAFLSTRSEEDRRRFERTLAAAQSAYPIREDHEFYLVYAPLALLRYAAMEIGKRLVTMGLLDKDDDVFYLEVPEARSALLELTDRRGLIETRKRQHAWIEAHPGPPSYGTPVPPPSMDPFPHEPRLLMEALMWRLERDTPDVKSIQRQTPGRPIRGIGASAGKYVGTVRVIMNESEFGKLQPGDVLVCPTTSPAWSVLFSSLGALVADSGGILSHPAIIAREFRVPAVVAAGNATEVLHDGQRVTVDGGAGVVRISG